MTTAITLAAGFTALGFLLIVSALAFWKENAILFMILYGVAMIIGLNAPDILAIGGATTNVGIAVGLGLIGFSLLAAGWSFRLMFWSEE